MVLSIFACDNPTHLKHHAINHFLKGRTKMIKRAILPPIFCFCGGLIGILIMVYLYLGSIVPYITQPPRVFFVAHLKNLEECSVPCRDCYNSICFVQTRVIMLFQFSISIGVYANTFMRTGAKKR